MRGTAEERFWAKVRRTPTCWEWTACRMKCGYGSFSANGKHCLAHRFSYELLVGPIPTGLTLDHVCRNRGCVNPAHLEPVTMTVNVLRGISPSAINARKTRCPKGHALTPDNLYPSDLAAGGRSCRRCMVEYHRKYTREWMAKWRIANRELARAKDKARYAGKKRDYMHARYHGEWYATNRERINACRRERYAKKREAARAGSR